MGPGPDGERLIYFGTLGGEVQAIRERDGRRVWRTEILSNREVPEAASFLERIANLLSFHRLDPTMLTGTPSLHDDVLYVPVSTRESFGVAVPFRPCCFASGSVVALNAQTGETIWRTNTVQGDPSFDPTTGQWAPAGGAVWSAPTIDPDRNLLYVGTAQNYSQPVSEGTNSVLAFDLDTGALRWSFKAEEVDAWNVACILPLPSLLGRSCPEPREQGHDFDFGSSPILADLPGGGQLVLAGHKGGVVHALNPDTGALVWETRISDGGTVGGVHFGMAYDGNAVYAATTDGDFGPDFSDLGELLGDLLRLDFTLVQPTPTARPGIYALDASTGAEQFVARTSYIDGEGNVQQSPYSAAPSVIPGAVLAGSLDGFLRAFSSVDGSLLWEFDSTQSFTSPDGRTGSGGSVGVSGPIVAGDMVFAGTGSLLEGSTGNVLFAFGLP
jgi:polyvinyl alcohol dehydrogenase (cytochrome)